MANIHDVNESLQVQPSVRNLPTLIALSQGENGRSLQFRMVGATIPSGSSASLSGTKPDGVVYSKAGTVDGNTVIFQEDVQLTAVAGAWDAKIHIVNSGNSVATALIRFIIDPDPVAAGAVPSDTQLEGIVAECKLYAEAARSNAYGSPLTASAAADMIDTAKVYVYTGDETGYAAGHWYYYNGSAWADGGVYNSIAIQTDTTLTLPDHAADAKATGDALATKADKIGNIALAERLYGGEYSAESEPYHFRRAPEGMGSKDETIVGGSLGWNQLMQNGNFENTSGWVTKNGTLSASGNIATITPATGTASSRVEKTSISIINSHKYLVSFFAKGDASIGYIETSWYGALVKYTPFTGNWTQIVIVYDNTFGTRNDWTLYIGTRANVGSDSDYQIKNVQFIDLTACFGTTIADYIYSLETATAGAGVAWVKRYIDLDTYHEYDAGSIQSVEGLQSHKTYDDDENLLASYSLDSSITLRGVPKLVTDHIEFDGDKYYADGSVARMYGERAYQSGDESLANAITDGTTTVYKLTTPTTDTAQPFQSPMIVGATEEYVSDSVVPVGHESKYYEDVAKKVSGLPKDFSTLIAPTEVTFTATRNYSVGSYLIVKNQLYKVTSAISSGGTITPNSNVTATTIMAEILALA